MGSISWTEIIKVAPLIVTAIIAWLTQRSKSRKEQIRSLQFDMVQLYQSCKKQGYKTELDEKLFCKAYDMYTCDLKQNSYICDVVAPGFRDIESEKDYSLKIKS